MSCLQDATATAPSAAPTNPKVQVEGCDVLGDPVVRYLAKACLRRGEHIVDVARELGVCADTLAVLLGVDA